MESSKCKELFRQLASTFTSIKMNRTVGTARVRECVRDVREQIVLLAGMTGAIRHGTCEPVS